MSSTSAVIIDIRNKILISVGITFIIVGTVGNLLNIILFRKRALWKLAPCVPFLLAASVINMIDIYSFLVLRTLIGFKITPAFYSSEICKLQLYLYYTTFCLSSWFMVACCADRFFSSSREPSIRRYSSTRMTTRVLISITIIIPLVYAQVFYCYEANQFSRPAPCFVKPNLCSVFENVYYFTFQTFGPPMLMFIFGIGTFIHIRQGQHMQREPVVRVDVATGTISTANTRNSKRSNREILRMLSIQVVLYLICTLPLLGMEIFSAIPSPYVLSNVELTVQNLLLNIAILLSFVDKIFSFYIYTLASKFYRQELMQLIARGRLQRAVAPQT